MLTGFAPDSDSPVVTLASPLARFDPAPLRPSYQRTELDPRASLSHYTPTACRHNSSSAGEVTRYGPMSAFGGKADITRMRRDVRF